MVKFVGILLCQIALVTAVLGINPKALQKAAEEETILEIYDIEHHQFPDKKYYSEQKFKTSKGKFVTWLLMTEHTPVIEPLQSQDGEMITTRVIYEYYDRFNKVRSATVADHSLDKSYYFTESERGSECGQKLLADTLEHGDVIQPRLLKCLTFELYFPEIKEKAQQTFIYGDNRTQQVWFPEEHGFIIDILSLKGATSLAGK